MEIITNSFKRSDLVKVTGRIDSATSSQLAETFNNIQKNGRYKIVFDMAAVDFISSSGLWVLVNAQKTSKRYNRGEIVLACVPARIYSTLDLAGFVPFFRTFDDVTAAVGYF
ncbi:MAG: STAS domain-containing protein [Chloroflexi bacterium]|nr:STAS domain-containing protein [Chloroflexota bacterium]